MGLYFVFVEGEIRFKKDYKIRIFEAVDFDLGTIESYGYEIYHKNKKLYWYDSHPHPDDPKLAETHPHHKHIPPNIKRNRVPTQNIKFNQANLPFLINEVIKLLQ